VKTDVTYMSNFVNIHKTLTFLDMANEYKIKMNLTGIFRLK